MRIGTVHTFVDEISPIILEFGDRFLFMECSNKDAQLAKNVRFLLSMKIIPNFTYRDTVQYT